MGSGMLAPMVTRPLRRLAGIAPSGIPGVRRLWYAGLGYVFGPPPFRAEPHPDDPGISGLLGPGSASWSVVGEPASIVGGLRALLVQLLHPHAMAGVSDHSGFREDPLARLRSTSAYVTTTTFGTTSEAVAAIRTVRRVHHHVRGVAPDGHAYRADDPHLLAWVCIAFTSSLLASDRAYATTPADPRTADRFVAEQSRVAALLDPRVDLDVLTTHPDVAAALRSGDVRLPMLEEGRLPRSVAELADAVATYRPELGVNEQGRAALRFLLWPRIPPAVKAAYLPLLAGALASLGPEDRELLGLRGAGPVLRPAELQTKIIFAGLRLAAGTSPARRRAEQRCAPVTGTGVRGG